MSKDRIKAFVLGDLQRLNVTLSLSGIVVAASILFFVFNIYVDFKTMRQDVASLPKTYVDRREMIIWTYRLSLMNKPLDQTKLYVPSFDLERPSIKELSAAIAIDAERRLDKTQ